MAGKEGDPPERFGRGLFQGGPHGADPSQDGPQIPDPGRGTTIPLGEIKVTTNPDFTNPQLQLPKINQSPSPPNPLPDGPFDFGQTPPPPSLQGAGDFGPPDEGAGGAGGGGGGLSGDGEDIREEEV
jgi:hypothetical protein